MRVSAFALCIGIFAAWSSAAPAALLHHWKLDESSGSTAADSAGGKNGTLVSSAAFVAGVAGNAISLDGTDDSINVPAGPPIDIINKSFSISLWMKRDTTTSADYAVGMGATAGTSQSLHIGYRSATQFTFAFWADDLNYTNATVVGNTTTFQHWLVTYDATTNTRSIYMNGGTTAVASNVATNDFLGSGTNIFWIGRRRDTGAGSFFDGLVDDVQVYSDVLDGDDAAFLFANPGMAVPEPATFGLLALGGLFLLGKVKRGRA